MWVYKSIPAKGVEEFFFGWEEGISGKFCIFVVSVMILRMRWLCGLLMVVLLVGCSTDERTLQLIGEAEGVMIEHPDSALTIMRSVDVETIRGKEDMAHYRLAMAEAYYYNRLAVSRDSLALPLFDYYLSSEDHSKRARAMYQHALVMQSEGENARAMYSLLAAEKSLEHIDNLRLKGLVHRTKGEIYGAECLYRLALEEHLVAKECFDRLELPIHSAYALYDIAVSYRYLRNFASSIEHLELAESRFLEYGYDLYVYFVQIELCYNYIQTDDFDSLRSVVSRIETNNNIGYSYCDYFCIRAVLSAFDGDFVSADAMLERAKCELEHNPMYLLYAEYKILKIKGDYAEALITYKSIIAIQDKHVFNIIDNSLLQNQIDLLSNKIDSAETLRMKNRVLYLLSAIIFALLLIALILIIVYRQRRYRENIKHYIETIADIELVNKSQICELDSAIEGLYRQSLNEINKLCEIYYEQGNSLHLASKVASQVEKNIEKLKNDQQRIDELELAVNVATNGIMRRLREQCPELGEREMRIALYTYAGFSNRAISLLVDCSSELLPKLKYSIREQIKRSNAVDAALLTEPLYNKKH